MSRTGISSLIGPQFRRHLPATAFVSLQSSPRERSFYPQPAVAIRSDESRHHRLSQYRAPLSPNQICAKLRTLPSSHCDYETRSGPTSRTARASAESFDPVKLGMMTLEHAAAYRTRFRRLLLVAFQNGRKQFRLSSLSLRARPRCDPTRCQDQRHISAPLD